MDDRLLQSFMTVVECGSVTVAAEKLRITQSALSRQIQSIEQTLGVSLFDRIGKKIRVSPEGEALRARINDVLIATRKLRASADGLRKGDAGVLRVGACSQLIERYFPLFLRRWREDYPAVEIRLEEGGGAELNARLSEGIVHLTINASSYAQSAEVDAVPLGRLEVQAVGSREFLDPSSEPISVEDVCVHPLLLLNRRHVSRSMLDAACRQYGLEPRVALESGSAHTLFSMAEGGVGVAVLPSSIRPYESDLVVRPIAVDGRSLDFEISAIWSRSAPLPAYGHKFVDMLSAHVADEQTRTGAPELAV
ncbi:LysR family transcriptional regulator [Oryzibacter oryziterrae]|uniref:LysR family transcriptional regulator n=1 Tax=Oryzibacter oryziterrae TaxID=2766474 RepID=UPI001F1A5EFC|nr:LysR family transcriptional regulator [Oryzibacter oryziterrae]